MSNVTLSHNARAVAVSAVNGVGLDATVVARVGFVVNIVVPFLLMSIVVLLVVPAELVHISAPITI
jgi:hypothetical protein